MCSMTKFHIQFSNTSCGGRITNTTLLTVNPVFHTLSSTLQVEKEANYRAIYRLLNNIISFFEPIQRQITPPDPMSTEPGAFKLRNPQFFYHHDVIQKLKKLYQEMRERLTKQDTNLEKFRTDLPEQWNFSLNTLRKVGGRCRKFISG
ncbi:uncharacterized protein DEA37_0003828 [Paragonimus westermani]|uniref:Uncharacterized protein n=1 Tax=Paragonimus westermani TaxID=34504 RepID=A0A5J4NDL3_9TREM|nr:uncharacterized protein DEA37_0003828 [Paragonimus westermani]